MVIKTEKPNMLGIKVLWLLQAFRCCLSLFTNARRHLSRDILCRPYFQEKIADLYTLVALVIIFFVLHLIYTYLVNMMVLLLLIIYIYVCISGLSIGIILNTNKTRTWRDYYLRLWHNLICCITLSKSYTTASTKIQIIYTWVFVSIHGD